MPAARIAGASTAGLPAPRRQARRRTSGRALQGLVHGQLAPLVAWLTAAFLLASAGGLQGLPLPLRAQLEGFPDAAIGGLGAAFAAGFVAGGLMVPRLVAAVGHLRTFAVMASLTAAGAAGLALVLDGWRPRELAAAIPSSSCSAAASTRSTASPWPTPTTAPRHRASSRPRAGESGGAAAETPQSGGIGQRS